MNKSMFSILFDYRGKINKQQFLCGILVLLITVSFSCSYSILHFSQTEIMKNLGNDSIGRWKFYYKYMHDFIPFFIPYRALIFYCTIILVLKRFRFLGYSNFTGFIGGLLIFIGFRALVSLSSLSMYMAKYRGSLYGLSPSTALIIFGTLFGIGLLLVIILYALRNPDDFTSKKILALFHFECVKLKSINLFIHIMF
jgi:uncharacterized membrane protein YhaH (DUF805 family)